MLAVLLVSLLHSTKIYASNHSNRLGRDNSSLVHKNFDAISHDNGTKNYLSNHSIGDKDSQEIASSDGTAWTLRKEPDDWHPEPAGNKSSYSSPITNDSIASSAEHRTEHADTKKTDIDAANDREQKHTSNTYDDDDESMTLKYIDWTVSPEYSVKLDTLSKASIIDKVAFTSFSCIGRPCECKETNLKITVGTIERNMKGIPCQKMFGSLKFSVLPGLDYDYEFHPTIILTGQSGRRSSLPGKTKSFRVSRELDPEIVRSFEFVLELEHKDFLELNLDMGSLTSTLKREITELSQMDARFISVGITSPSARHQQLGKRRIQIVFARISGSTQPQMAMEAMRNLYLPQSKETLLSKLVHHSASVQIASVKSKFNLSRVEDELTQNIGFNYGALFISMIVLSICCFLTSKCLPSRFSRFVGFCKVVCAVIIRQMGDLVDLVSNSSFLKANRNSSEIWRAGNYGELNVSDGESDEEEENVAMMLFERVLKEEDVPPFTRERYIKLLKDDWVTTYEQLQQMSSADWIRFGVPKNIQCAVRTALLDDKRREKESTKLNVEKSSENKKLKDTTAEFSENTYFSDF